jgi:hypothetical protein
LEALEGRLLAWVQQQRSAVHVVMEKSQGLVGDGRSPTRFWGYLVNPKVSDARRQPSGAKTNRREAALWARWGWTDRDPRRPLRPADEALTQPATRLTNPLLAALKSYDPQVLAAFADMSRPVALAFWATWPDPQDARRLTVNEVRTWLRPPHHPRAAQAAPRIWGALPQRAVDASPGQRRAQVWAVRALVAPLHAWQTEQRALREHLAELFWRARMLTAG